MKKIILSAFLLTVIAYCAQAQTKVFNEVSDEISTQIKTITQDNALVGYMVFARLEKASEDSFNYRVTILDENLNDIGKVEFREEGLTLQDVSFDQDVLCIAYLKSNILGNNYKNKKEYTAALSKMSNAVFMQFLNLKGEILKTYSFNVALSLSNNPNTVNGALIADGGLKHALQLKNITKKGFACFYGDKNANSILVFSVRANLLWQKTVNTEADLFYMQTAGRDIYLLTKNKTFEFDGDEGGYALLCYTTSDTTVELSYPLKDQRGHQLKVFAFDIDPVTGRPYLAGSIINPLITVTGKTIVHAPYLGLFALNVYGHTSADMKGIYTYWSDNWKAGFSKKESESSYASFVSAFRDFSGNTYFAGSEIAMQDKDGTLSSDNVIPLDHRSYVRLFHAGMRIDNRTFYPVLNADTKTNYLVADDDKNISIYNVSQKKLLRTIPHKDGGIKTEVYPAKDGYVMVVEYNKKEKYTRFSIEAL